MTQSSQRFHQLSLSISLHTGNAQYLSGQDIEGDAIHGQYVSIVKYFEIFNPQSQLGRLGLRFLDFQYHIPPDHHRGEHVLVGILWCGSSDNLALADHRDAISYLKHLSQLVGNEDDRFPAFGQ